MFDGKKQKIEWIEIKKMWIKIGENIVKIIDVLLKRNIREKKKISKK